MSILAAVDGEAGSEAVLEEGYALARAFDEDLIVLHVLPETEDREQAEVVARGLVEETLDKPENVSIVGRLGDPEARILSQADDEDARYIVLGSRKQTPVGKALFGSVAQVVMLNTDRSVVVVSGSG